MNRKELIDIVSATADIPKDLTDRAISATTNAIATAAKNGDSTILIGFGTFKPVTRKARDGRNPKTGEVIKIPEKNSLTFKPGTAVKEYLN